MHSLNLAAYTTPYTTHSSSTGEDLAYAGAVIFIMLFLFAVIAITYVVNAFFLSRIFKKAGVDSWKAWVPVYSNWVLLEMGGQKGWWAVLAFIPLVNIAAGVFMIIAMYHVGVKFGKDSAFVLLAVFIPIVWLAWLAFDSSKWHGDSKTNHPDNLPTSQK